MVLIIYAHKTVLHRMIKTHYHILQSMQLPRRARV